VAPTVPARHFQPYGHTDSGVLAYPRGLGLGAEWHPASHSSARSRCRAHVDHAAEHIQAVAYVLQPPARLGASGIEPATVVAHLEAEPPVFDIAALKKQGVEKLFTPATPMQDVVDWLRKRFPEEKRLQQLSVS